MLRMANLGTMRGDIEIDVSGAQASLARLQESVQQQSQQIGQKMQRIGGALSLGVTAPIAGLAAAAAKEFGTFDENLRLIRQMTSATGDTMDAMREKALELGRVTSFSAGDATQAMLELVKGGFDTEKALGAISGTLNLAAASGIDLASSAEVVTDVLATFNLPASALDSTVDAMAGSVNNAAQGFGELTYAMQTAAAPFSNAGFSVQDLSAALAVMANQGLKGQRAGTTLGRVITELSNPRNDAAAGMIHDLGINVFNAAGEFNSFRDILGDMEQGLKGMTAEQRTQSLATIFGGDAIKAVLPLLNAGVAGFDELKAAVQEEGSAMGLAEASMASFNGALKYIQGTIGTVLISAIEPLAETIGTVIRKVADFIAKFATLPPGARQWIGIFAGIAAAAGPFLLILGKVVAVGGAIFAALNPVTLVILGVSAAVLLLSNRFKWFAGLRQRLAKWLEIGPIERMQKAFEGFSAYTERLKGIDGLWAKIRDIWHVGLGDVESNLWTGIAQFLHGGDMSKVQDMAGTWDEIPQLFIEKFKAAFKKGGPVAKAIRKIWQKFTRGLTQFFSRLGFKTSEADPGGVWHPWADRLQRGFADLFDHNSELRQKLREQWEFFTEDVFRWFTENLLPPGSQVAIGDWGAMGSALVDQFRSLFRRDGPVHRAIRDVWWSFSNNILLWLSPAGADIGRGRAHWEDESIFKLWAEAIQDRFASMFGRNGNVRRAMQSTWEDFEVGAWNWIARRVLPADTEIGSDTEGTWSEIGDAIGDRWDDALAKGSDLWGDIKEEWDDFAERAWKWIAKQEIEPDADRKADGIWDKVSAALGKTWEKVFGTENTLWNDITAAWQAFRTSISTLVQTALNIEFPEGAGVIETWRSVTEQLRTGWENAVGPGSALRTAMSNVWQGLKTFLGGLVRGRLPLKIDRKPKWFEELAEREKGTPWEYMSQAEFRKAQARHTNELARWQEQVDQFTDPASHLGGMKPEAHAAVLEEWEALHRARPHSVWEGMERPAWMDLMDQQAEADSQAAIDQFFAPWRNLFDGLRQKWEEFLGPTSELRQKLSDVWTKFKTFVQTLVQTAIDMAAGDPENRTWDNFKAALSGDFAALLDAGGELFLGIQNTWNAFRARVWTWLTGSPPLGTPETLIPDLEDPDYLTKLLEFQPPARIPIWDDLQEIIQEGWQLLLAAGSALWTNIKATWTDFGSRVWDWLKGAAIAVTGGGDDDVPMWKKIRNFIAGWFAAIFVSGSALWKGLRAIWTVFGTMAWNWFKGLVIPAGTDPGTITLWDAVVAKIGAWLGKAWDDAGTFWTDLQTHWDAFTKDVWDWVKERRIKAGADPENITMWTAVTGTIAGWWDAALATGQSLWTRLGTHWDSFSTRVWAWVVARRIQAGEAGGSMWNRITAKVSGWWNAALQKGTSLWDSLGDAWDTFEAQIWTWAMGLVVAAGETPAEGAGTWALVLQALGLQFAKAVGPDSQFRKDIDAAWDKTNTAISNRIRTTFLQNVEELDAAGAAPELKAPTDEMIQDWAADSLFPAAAEAGLSAMTANVAAHIAGEHGILGQMYTAFTFGLGHTLGKIIAQINLATEVIKYAILGMFVPGFRDLNTQINAILKAGDQGLTTGLLAGIETEQQRYREMLAPVTEPLGIELFEPVMTWGEFGQEVMPLWRPPPPRPALPEDTSFEDTVNRQIAQGEEAAKKGNRGWQQQLTENLGNALQNFQPAALTGGPVFSVLPSLLMSSLQAGLTAAWDGFAAWFQETLATPFAGLWTDMFQVDILGTVGTFFTDLGTDITEGFTGLKDNWDATVKGFRAKVESLWSGLRLYALIQWNLLVTSWKVWWTARKNGFDEVVKGFKEKVETFWTALKDFIVETWEAAWEAVKAAIVGDKAKGVLGLWDRLGEGLTLVMDKVTAQIDRITNSIEGAIAAFNRLKELNPLGYFKRKAREAEETQVRIQAAGFAGMMPFAEEEAEEVKKGGNWFTRLLGFQHGTKHHPGGLSWVGEAGPELIAPPRGSQVFSHDDSMRMMREQNALLREQTRLLQDLEQSQVNVTAHYDAQPDEDLLSQVQYARALLRA